MIKKIKCKLYTLNKIIYLLFDKMRYIYYVIIEIFKLQTIHILFNYRI